MRNLIGESARLRIRKFTAADNIFVYKLLNSPTWLAMIGDRHVHNLLAATHFIKQNILRDYKKLGYGFYLVERIEDKTPIGLCGITKRPEMQIPDLGFALLPSFQGHGYMQEAAELVITHSKKDLLLPKLNAFTAENNMACQKLLLKLNFSYVEVTYEAFFSSWVKSYQLVL